MQEPTVLDFVKAIFRDWKSFTRFVIALFDPSRRAELPYLSYLLNSVPPTEASEPFPPPPPEPPPPPLADSAPLQPPLSFPWRPLLALTLALIAQRTFEPPHLNPLPGIVFYLAAFGVMLGAIRRGEWTLAETPPSNRHVDPLSMRPIPFLLTVPLTVIAFFAFDDGLFHRYNLVLWLAALILFCLSVWLPHRQTRLRPALDWRRLAALVIVLGVTAFFRFYRLESVPAEPFSDHAEKLLDIYDLTQGQTRVFFPRNTGREGFQMYWTWLVMNLFGTGMTFMSLKLGTALLGFFTLPYMYLLGKEVGGQRVGLLAMFLFGIAYWPNVISRVGLRFPLYPLFTAPVLFYLLRGLRTHNRNDFIQCGLFLGLGLHGYSPFRVVPLLVVLAFLLYLLHNRSKSASLQTQLWLAITAMTALLVFLPLFRYMLSEPAAFWFRTATRIGQTEQPYPGAVWQILLHNLWNGLRMFNWDNGAIWVNSVMDRPALDVVGGALFLIGVFLLVVRYARRRFWLDIFLLLSIIILQLPSTLSLAYPNENPALNRASGAAVPVFLVVGLALDGLLTGLGSRVNRKWGAAFGWGVAVILLASSSYLNYRLVFEQYAQQYRQAAWNTSDIGRAIGDFMLTHRSANAWVVPSPHWVDTRLPGSWIGIPNRDFALWPEQFASTLALPGPKFFVVRAGETETMVALQALYPQGLWRLYPNDIPGHEFLTLTVP